VTGPGRIAVSTYSEVGGHRHNEDAFLVEQLPSDSNSWICVVADGQGGQSGGGEAARLACDSCAATARTLTRTELLRATTWNAILSASDQAICRHPVAGYTTLVAFFVAETAVCGGSNGDSAAALLRGERAAELLTAAQRKHPPVGSGCATFIPFAARLDLPWCVLAVTHGVWKYGNRERMLSLNPRTPGPAMIATLLETAKASCSGRLQDDFTVVALQDSAAPPELSPP
jgi:hypothetical protein